jgi:hypothetical protein
MKKEELLILINVDRGRIWSAAKNMPAPKVKIIEFNIDTGVVRFAPEYVDKEFVENIAIMAKHSNEPTPMSVLPAVCRKCLKHIKNCMKGGEVTR